MASRDISRPPVVEDPPTALSANDQADERYINREQLRVLVPVSDMTIWRWTANPGIGFPKPVKLVAGGRNFWWLPAVREFLRRKTCSVPQQGRPEITLRCAISIWLLCGPLSFPSDSDRARSVCPVGRSAPPAWMMPVNCDLQPDFACRNEAALGDTNRSNLYWYLRQPLNCRPTWTGNEMARSSKGSVQYLS